MPRKLLTENELLILLAEWHPQDSQIMNVVTQKGPKESLWEEQVII